MNTQLTDEQITSIASVTHEANRAYCHTLNDFSQLAWSDAPEWQRDSAIAGVKSVLDGSAKTPEEQHETWCAFKVADGWAYGAVKDATARTHPCLVPYAELPAAQKYKDILFRAAVVALTTDPDAPPAADPSHELISAAPLPDAVAGAEVVPPVAHHDVLNAIVDGGLPQTLDGRPTPAVLVHDNAEPYVHISYFRKALAWIDAKATDEVGSVKTFIAVHFPSLGGNG